MSVAEARVRAIALLRAHDAREAEAALRPHAPAFEAALRLIEAGHPGYALVVLEDCAPVEAAP